MRQKDDIRPSPVAQSQEERLRQLEEENRRLQEQVGTTRQNYESQLAEQRNSEQEKLRRLEEENRRLREQAGTAQRNYESQLAELQGPQLNAQVYDILPQELIVRSGDESGANQITLPPGRQKFTLILNGAGLKAYPNYSIEIINQRGRTIWRGKGLKRGKDGNFVMTLDRTFLNKGEYRLKLYGQTDGGAQSAAEYRIVVNN